MDNVDQSVWTEKEAESEFVEAFRKVFNRSGLRRVGEIVGEEIRGLGLLVITNRNTAPPLLAAAQRVEQSLTAIANEFGV